MSNFPLLIKLVDNGIYMIITDPKNLPDGVAFTILATQVTIQ